MLPAVRNELEAWVYAERYLGLGTQDYSKQATVSSASPEYRPDSGASSFLLPTRLVHGSAAEVLTSGAAHPALTRRCSRDQVIVPLHPDAYTMMNSESKAAWDSWPEGPAIRVSPLANTRTVVVLDNAPCGAKNTRFVKLHFPGQLSRFHRTLPEHEIIHHLLVSSELEKMSVPVLSERAGVVYRGGPETPWGFLIRNPHQIISPRSLIIPGFALYGKDTLRTSDPIILKQLIKTAGRSPETYIIEFLIRPIVRIWVSTALDSGFLLAMHGQNTLYRASLDTGSGEVFYRGCSVYVDEHLRGKTDFSEKGLHRKIIKISEKARSAAIRSLIYDSFVGHHFLDYIDRFAQSEYGILPGRLAAVARDEFKRMGGNEIPMPSTIHYYRDITVSAADACESETFDTGSTTKWR